MTSDRFQSITSRYAHLRVVVFGDFCLDRYLEIDPVRAEISIETGLPVYNVARVRAQAGGAGTIVNNLVALGVGTIDVVGFSGDDGEGYELRRELAALRGVNTEHFVTTSERSTFTYCKPLVMEPGQPPRELNRFDTKNWSTTPQSLERRLGEGLKAVIPRADALVVLNQVDRPGTGAVTTALLNILASLVDAKPSLPALADSRGGFRGWPPLSFKMNAAELTAYLDRPGAESVELDHVKSTAAELAARHRRPIFITLSERGIVGAEPDGQVAHVPALPLRGPIDIVGAGDSVTANLATALAAGASILEAIELASIASSIVIHQLGTTGTARVEDLKNFIEF